MSADQESTSTAQPDAAANDPVASVGQRLDADGRERPRFLLSFPSDPQLDVLVRAFERGDFASVREAAPKLAASTADPAVRAAALELRRRIDPDPTVVRLLLLACALLIFVSVWAYASQH